MGFEPVGKRPVFVGEGPLRSAWRWSYLVDLGTEVVPVLSYRAFALSQVLDLGERGRFVVREIRGRAVVAVPEGPELATYRTAPTPKTIVAAPVELAAPWWRRLLAWIRG